MGATRARSPCRTGTSKRRDDVNAVIDDWLADNGWTAENRIDYVKEEFSGPAARWRDDLRLYRDFDSGELVTLSCVSLEVFNRLTGRNDVLEPGQIYLFPYDGDSIELLVWSLRHSTPATWTLMATIHPAATTRLYGDILTLVTPDNGHGWRNLTGGSRRCTAARPRRSSIRPPSTLPSRWTLKPSSIRTI